MNITYIEFVPSSSGPFHFQAVLDGVQYNISVTWNIFGLRYYINVYTVQGELILAAPMVGSPDGYSIDLLLGRFTSTLVYRETSGNFEVADGSQSNDGFAARPTAMLNANSSAFVLNQGVLS